MDLIYKTIESVQRHGASSRGDMSREQWARDRAIFVAVSAHNILRTLRDDLDADDREEEPERGGAAGVAGRVAVLRLDAALDAAHGGDADGGAELERAVEDRAGARR